MTRHYCETCGTDCAGRCWGISRPTDVPPTAVEVDPHLTAVVWRLLAVVGFALLAALVMTVSAWAQSLPATALSCRTQHPSAVQPARRRHPSTQTESDQ